MRIAIEGGEGAGKSTLIKLLDELFHVSAHVAEGKLPGRDREVIFASNQVIQAIAFAMERKDLNQEVYKPLADKLVVTDRSIMSNLVYQGPELGPAMVYEINRTIDPDFSMPDLIILLDSDPEFNLKRMRDQGREMDGNDLKSLEFHKSIRENYLKLSKVDGLNVHVIENVHLYDLKDLANELRGLVPKEFWKGGD